MKWVCVEISVGGSIMDISDSLCGGTFIKIKQVMIIDLPTVTLPSEALKENLHISRILLFDDDNEHCTIFLEGWKNLEMIQRACIL